MSDENQRRTMVSLVILGVCDALKVKSISISEAERLVFSPYMMHLCRDCGPDLVDAIHLGTELNDIHDLVPEQFPKTLDRIQDLATSCLKKQVSNLSFYDSRWTGLLP